MCGICAVVSSTLSLAETETFKDLLLVNQLRGFDSTGVFAVDRKDTTKPNQTRFGFFKEACEASFFLNSEDKHGVKKSLLTSGHSALVGHCRWATIGKVNAKNAHPFNFENVIGVHNGTLRKNFRYSNDFETDSEALYANINEFGLEAALNEIQTWSETDCAYALIYYDKVEDTLNFIRNGQRPLYGVLDSALNSLFVSSEAEAVYFATKRHGISFGDGGIFQLKPNVLMSIKMDTMEYYLKDRQQLTELKIEKPKYTSPKSYNQNNPNDGYWLNGVWRPYNSPFYDLSDWPDEDLPEADPNARPPFDPSGLITHDYGTKNPPFTPGKTTNPDLCCDVPPAQENKTSVPVVSGKELVKQEPSKPQIRNMFFRGWKGISISRILMGKYCRAGCRSCGRVVDIDMHDLEKHIGWTSPNGIICPECMTRPQILKYWVKWSHKTNPIDSPTTASLQ